MGPSFAQRFEILDIEFDIERAERSDLTLSNSNSFEGKVDQQDPLSSKKNEASFLNHDSY